MTEKRKDFTKLLATILVGGGLIGLVASFVLTIETFHVIADPSYDPTCNISPILSCGSVMKTGQARALGFPDPVAGLVAFSAVITVGMAIFAGAQFKKWFWQAFQVGALLGVSFMHWLFFQSLYELGTLCPYCMVVWAVTIPIFWYTLVFNLSQGHIPVPKQLEGTSRFIQKHHGDIVVTWFVILIALILHRFWDYWMTLI